MLAQVVRATIIMDKKTGNSRGYGFVDMASEEDADRALALHGTKFHGRVIGVERVRALVPQPASIELAADGNS